MEYYETADDYTKVQISQILEWFNRVIGTDYDLNESASGEDDEFYLVFSDLEGDEPQQIRQFEINFRIEEGLE